MSRRAFATSEELDDRIHEYIAGLAPDQIPTLGDLYKFLGISKRTVANYCAEDHEFCDVMTAGKEHIEAILEQKLVNLPKGKNVVGLIFYLKNAFKWSDNRTLEVSGPGGGPIGILAVPMEAMSLEEWEGNMKAVSDGASGLTPKLEAQLVNASKTKD